MQPGWINILTSTNYFQAQIIEGLLVENHIPVIIMNKKDSSYLFGNIEVYVKENDAKNAKRLIEKQKS